MPLCRAGVLLISASHSPFIPVLLQKMGMSQDDKRSRCLLEIQETEAKYCRTLEDIEKVLPKKLHPPALDTGGLLPSLYLDLCSRPACPLPLDSATLAGRDSPQCCPLLAARFLQLLLPLISH